MKERQDNRWRCPSDYPYRQESLSPTWAPTLTRGLGTHPKLGKRLETNARLRLPTELVFPIILDVLLDYFDELFTQSGGVVHSDGSVWTNRLTANPITSLLVVSYQFRAITVDLLVKLLGIQPAMGEPLPTCHKIVWRYIKPVLDILKIISQGGEHSNPFPRRFVSQRSPILTFYVTRALIYLSCDNISARPSLLPIQYRNSAGIFDSYKYLRNARWFCRDRYLERWGLMLYDWSQVVIFVQCRSSAIHCLNRVQELSASLKSQGREIPYGITEQITQTMCEYLTTLDPYGARVQRSLDEFRRRCGPVEAKPTMDIFKYSDIPALLRHIPLLKAFLTGEQFARCDKLARRVIYHWSLEGPEFADALLDIYGFHNDDD